MVAIRTRNNLRDRLGNLATSPMDRLHHPTTSGDYFVRSPLYRSDTLALQGNYITTIVKKLILIACASLTLGTLSSCDTVATTAGNILPASTADSIAIGGEKAYEGAFNLFDIFDHLEHDQRAALAKVSPEIHEYAQVMRRNGRVWVLQVQELTDAFEANPSAANKANMAQAVSVVNTAVTKVKTYMSQAEAAGVKGGS